ncbi:MAG: YybH family protein [Pseudomonadales bacterium]
MILSSKRLTWFHYVLLFVMGHTGTALAAGPTTVEEATANFYQALNVMFTGDGGPMKEAWSHADDITYMGPGGNYLVGWRDIEKEWDAQTARKLGGRVTPTDLHTTESGDLAVINCIESGENAVGGKSEVVKIRSSTVFRREAGIWKVIGHQTDKLGFLEGDDS